MPWFSAQNLTGGINTTAEENDLIFFNDGGTGSEARDIENFVPLVRGGQQKASGFSLYQSIGNLPIRGLYRFIKSDGSNYFLAVTGGRVYRLLNGAATDIGMSLSTTAWVQFTTALDTCIVCDGVGALQRYDGASITTLTSGGSTNYLGGTRQTLFYQNRLWAFGNAANASLLYYSNPNDVTSGYSTQFINCNTNDGQSITGICPLFIPGRLSPIILVAKTRSVGMVTGDGSSGNPYTYVTINPEVGVSAFRQFVAFGGDVAYLTPKGISTYRTNILNNNLQYGTLSDKVQDQFLSLPAASLADAHAIYDWKRYRISFAVTETAYDYPNVLWHYDVRTGGWYKERWGNPHRCCCSWIDADGTWYHGDSLGNIMVHDTSGSFNGSPIMAYYKTPFLDFSKPNVLKHIQEAQLVLRGNGAYTLGVSTSLDYGDRTGKSSQLAVNQTAYTWGGGIWTSNAPTYQWGGSPIKTRRFYPSGYFRQIQFTLTQSGINQPLALFGLSFWVV